MFPYHFTIAAPWALLLLAAVPLCWWWSQRPLAALGPWRRRLALTLRSLLLAALALAVADPQLVRRHARLTVLFLLDQSASVPSELRRQALAYVGAAVAAQRRGEDRAGLIVFGREAAVEVPPDDEPLPIPSTVESVIDPQHTNLAAAMKLAQASFPADAARRIVLVSDGNQTQGDAAAAARQLAATGVSVDVLPLRCAFPADVSVERVAIPADVRRGQPIDIRIVLVNSAIPGASAASGRLSLTRTAAQGVVALSAAPHDRLALPPGKSVFVVRQQIDEPGFYAYEARFTPDRAADDAVTQNNRATGFTHVRGRNAVLIIEDARQRGRYELLAARLRRQNRDVTVRGSDQAFADLADLQPFDAVVIADVPREAFSDAQLAALVQNTQQLGAGLLMLGGENGFGAGGWAGSEMERAMPVDFQPSDAVVVPAGALVMLLDKSGSMTGQKLELSKAAASEAVRMLGRRDYVGVVAFDAQSHWIAPLQRVDDPAAIIGRIARLSGGGGTDLGPGMTAGYRALHAVGAAVKHMIVLTDGITTGAGYVELAAHMQAEGITVSCVAVGADADAKLMGQIAQAGGGRAHYVIRPQAVPRIFQQEARRVVRPLVYENRRGFSVQRVRSSADQEMLRGFSGPLPALSGLVLTSRKSNRLVETLLTATEPADSQVNTLLAAWTYGLGRVVAFTSDAASRWMADWMRSGDYESYDRLFGQIIAWCSRPLADDGRIELAAEMADGQLRLVATTLDQSDRFLNSLGMTAAAVGPDLKPRPIVMEQVASGRCVGRLATPQPGDYFLAVSPGPGRAPLRLGVSVPQTEEFRDRTTNEALLASLAAMQPPGGPPGKILPPLEGRASLAPQLAVDCFRRDLPPARSSQPIWSWLAFAACGLLLADVFVRRVEVRFDGALAALRGPFLRRATVPVAGGHLKRLRTRKAEVAGRIEQLRAAAQRGEQTTDECGVTTAAPQTPPAVAAAAPSPSNEAAGYTARLLKAKKQAWEKDERPR